MNVENTQQVIRILETVEEKNLGFDMDYWLQDYNFDSKPNKKIEHYCGTTACVAGWMALDPFFNKQGFVPVKNGWGVTHVTLKVGDKECVDYTAIAELLSIPMEHSIGIFTNINMNSEDIADWGESDWIYRPDINNVDDNPESDYLYKSVTPEQVIAVLSEYIETNGKNVEDALKEMRSYSGGI